MPYKLTQEASVDGTSGAGEVLLAPASLVRRFGKPYRGIETKISGEYIFTETSTGRLFTLYDYKSTSRYGPGLPDPDDFWHETEPQWFNIGNSEDDEDLAEKLAPDFARWLRLELAFQVQ